MSVSQSVYVFLQVLFLTLLSLSLSGSAKIAIDNEWYRPIYWSTLDQYRGQTVYVRTGLDIPLGQIILPSSQKQRKTKENNELITGVFKEAIGLLHVGMDERMPNIFHKKRTEMIETVIVLV